MHNDKTTTNVDDRKSAAMKKVLRQAEMRRKREESQRAQQCQERREEGLKERKARGEERHRREELQKQADEEERLKRQEQDIKQRDVEEEAWQQFEQHPPERLTVANLPQFSAAALRARLLQRDSNHVFKEMSLRWHPDRFLPKFGHLVKSEDQDAVRDAVTTIFRSVRRCWDASRDKANQENA